MRLQSKETNDYKVIVLRLPPVKQMRNLSKELKEYKVIEIELPLEGLLDILSK